MSINYYFLTILLVTSIMPVSADELADMQDLINLDIEDLLDITIVKSASKYTQGTATAPASVSVFTEEDIRRYGYRTLTDLLSGVRGLYKIDDSGYEYLGIRGFSRPGDYGTRILLLIDGHKVNENIVGMASVDSTFNLDMDLIKRVEIVHGPSSSLYGAGAFLAVINVFTKSGKALDSKVISASLADHERTKVHASYGKELETGLEFLVSASFDDYPGQDLYLPAFDNPEQGGNGIAHQQDHENAQRLFAKMHYQDFTLTASYMKRDKGMAIPFFSSTLESSTDVKDMRAYLDLAYHHSFTENGEANLRLSYNAFRYDGYYYYPLEEETGYLLNRDELQGRWWNGEGQLQWLWGKHRFISGIEYQANISQQMRNYDQLPFFEEIAYSDTSDNYWALYCQDELSLTEKLTFNAGIRYDYYATFGDTIHPRIALIYRPIEKTSIKLLIGSAFRAPSAFEMYIDDGLFYKRNLKLEAETIQSYEMALEHRFDEKTHGLLSLYRYKVEDLIESNLDPEDNLIFYDNMGTATARGLETELRKRWDNGIESRIGYAWQEVKNDYGERLSALPRHLLKLRSSMPLNEIWRVALEVRYTDAMETYKLPRETLSSYTLTNFTITGELFKKLQLSASVYNLFDTEYAYPISDEFEPDRFAGEARNFRVKLDYQF